MGDLVDIHSRMNGYYIAHHPSAPNIILCHGPTRLAARGKEYDLAVLPTTLRLRKLLTEPNRPVDKFIIRDGLADAHVSHLAIEDRNESGGLLFFPFYGYTGEQDTHACASDLFRDLAGPGEHLILRYPLGWAIEWVIDGVDFDQYRNLRPDAIDYCDVVSVTLTAEDLGLTEDASVDR